MRSAVAVLVCLAACTDVPAITSGVCGNHVVEPSEDCDRPGTACTADCRIACDPTMSGDVCASADAIDGSCCPGGFACGLDSVCHAPTGNFAPEMIQPLSANGFGIADLDGDGRKDLLAISTSSIFVRHGAATAPLASGEQLQSPFATGQSGFGDFTGDGKPDVLVPILNGIAGFETSSGTAEPFVFPAAIGNPGDVFLRGAGLMAPLVARIDQSAGMLMMYRQGGLGTPTPFQPCGLVADHTMLRGRGLHPYADAGSWRVPIELSNLAGMVGVQLCIDTVQGSGTQLQVLTGYSTGPDGEIFLADLDGSGGCPDLVAPLLTKTDKIETTYVDPPTAGALVGNCTVDPTKGFEVRTVDPVSLTSSPIGIPMAAIALDTQPAAVGLITSTGIYAVDTRPVASGKTSAGSNMTQLVDTTTDFIVAGVQPGDLVFTHAAVGVLMGKDQLAVVQTVNHTSLVFTQPLTTTLATGLNYTVDLPATPIAAATRSWRYVEVRDLDQDGRADFVTTGTSNDVEVFMQRASTSMVPELHGTRILTDESIQLLATGDFDGDGLGDIAMVAADPSGTTGDLSVAFANGPGLFAAPAAIASLPGLAFVTGLNLTDPTVPAGYDQNDDLVLGYGVVNAGDKAKLAHFYGSGSRQLSAPWVKPTTMTVAGGFPVGWAVQTADLLPGTPTAIAFFGNDNADTNNTLAAVLAFDGDTFQSTFAQTPFTSCIPDTATFCPPDSRFTTWHRSTGDLVLMLRGSGEKFSMPPSVCGAYVQYTSMVSSDLTLASCDDLIGAGNHYATWFWGLLTAHIVSSDDSSALLWTSKPSDAAGTGALNSIVRSTGLLWKMTASPALTLQLAMDPQMELGAGTDCFELAQAELGTRTVNGVLYGDGGPEYVLACEFGAGLTTKLYARYAASDGGAPYYEQVADLQQNVRVNIRAGDFDGDGLDDLAYLTYARSGIELHVQLQCDTHSTACVQAGGK
jgi:hypothetical protein